MIKVDELEKWLETDEGKQWLEEKKKPLVEKRDQLLNELADTKKRLADAGEKSDAQSAKIKEYFANLTKSHCARVLDGGNAKKEKVMPDEELREFVKSKIEKMAEADGGFIPDIDDSGNFRLATADGKSFEDYFNEWAGTEKAKSFLQCQVCGGGAKGSDFGASVGGFDRNAVKNMTPQEVAERLDNPSFRNSFDGS